MNIKLRENIDEIYLAFAPYKVGSKIHEISRNYEPSSIRDWNRALLSKPMKELTADDLSTICAKGITTWGSASDYKHFLPRILELTAQIDPPPYDTWLIFDRIEMAGKSTWPENEKKLIDTYMLLLWEEVLCTSGLKLYMDFRSYFSTLAHFTNDFSSLIEVWQNCESFNSIIHLHGYLSLEYDQIFHNGVIPGGIYDKSENAEEFGLWLLSPELENKLNGFTKDSDDSEIIDEIKQLLSI